MKVINVEKVGKVIFHYTDKQIPNLITLLNSTVTGFVDKARRDQLKHHHTATHVMFASCRKILGPHIWQAGAKKTEEQAHLDITHYSSLTKE